MRRRELLVNKANVGTSTDVLFVSKRTLAKQIFKSSEWPSSSDWTPIGIVVVPSSHDRYGDGTCGVMSLGGISSNGTIQTNGLADGPNMKWGDDSYNTSLTDYGTVEGSNTDGYVHLQTDSESTSCSFGGTPNIQYPYTALNGTEVQSYSAGSLSDYDGIGNTNILNSSEYPAAYACKQVSTLGTSHGDWYLPAFGELAYLPSIRFEVNKTISSLLSIYGNVGSLLRTTGSYYYWSSTEYNTHYAWRVVFSNGYVLYRSKNPEHMVRAFLRFNPSTNKIVTT